MRKRFLSLLAVAFLGLILLVSCGKTYLVDFDTDGGSEVATVEVKEGEVLTLPADPEKDGLTFAGWYTDPNCLKAFDASAKITEDTTLYAKWLVKLTFNSNGGSEVEPILAKGSSVYELPANPVREGFAFIGWYTDEALTKELPALVFPAKNTTAYAKWLAFDNTTKVELKGFASNDPNAFEVEGNTFTATAAKGNYTFIYTEFKQNLAGYDTVVLNVVGTKDVKVLLKFEGDGVAVTEQEYTLTGEDQEIIWTVPADTLKGTGVGAAKFGFFLAPGEFGTVNDAPNEEVVGASIEVKSAYIYRTLTPGLENKDVAITYIANGGTSVAAQFVAKGTVATAATATRNGYELEGWYIDADLTQAFDWTAAVNENVTLYAKWEKTLYDVSFDVNGHGTALDSVKAGFLPKPLPKLTEEGYSFKGWFYDEELTKPARANDELFANVTLYAKWVEGDDVVKTFDLLLDTYVSNDAGSIDVTQANGVLTVKKNTVVDKPETDWNDADNAWAFVRGSLKGSALEGYTTLTIYVKGVKDQKILFKPNDNGAAANEHTCTGNVDVVVLDLTKIENINANGWAMYIFVGAGTAGESGEFVINNMVLSTGAPEHNLLLDTFVSNDAGSIDVTQVNGVLTVKKNTLVDKPETDWNDADNAWAFVRGSFKGSLLEGYTTLTIYVKGEKDQKILFKPNDNGAAANEHTCTGGLDRVVLDLTKIENINANGWAMYLFVGAGTAGESGEFVISKMVLGNDLADYDLLNDTFVSNDAGSIDVEQADGVLTLQKNTLVDKPETDWNDADNAWAFVRSSAKGSALEGYTTMTILVKGEKDQKILFKPNDNGAAANEHTCTGNVDVVVLDLTKIENINANGWAMYIFVGAGTAGESGEFVIYSMELSVNAVSQDLLLDTYVSNDAGSIDVEQADGVLAVQKNTVADKPETDWNDADNAWAFVRGSLKGSALEGYSTLTIAVKGEKDQKILFKANDNGAASNEHTCTGNLDIIVIDLTKIETINVNSWAMYLFVGAGTAGESGVFEIVYMTLEK